MKHLGIVSQAQDLVTLEVLRSLSTKWSFGDGPPSDAAGVLGEHYVEANNRVWIKTAPYWIFTGIQLGSSANVAEKAVLLDADIIGIGDSANNLQMRKVTVASFRTQFLSTALADAAASPDLPATGTSIGWQSIVQTLRNGLKWLTSRFNSSGQLSPQFGGTGTNDLANLPVSTAQAAAIAERLDRTAGNWLPLANIVLGDAHGFPRAGGYRVYFLPSSAANRPPAPSGNDGPLEVFCYGPAATNYCFIRFHDWRTGQIWTQSQAAEYGGDGWGPWQRQSWESYRTLPAGITNVATSANWFSLGTLRLLPSQAARITVLGTQSYSDGSPCAGETIISLRGTNDLENVGISGYFYGHSFGSGTIQEVALLRLPDRTWRIFVKSAAFMSLSAMCDTSGSSSFASASFVPEAIDTGSETKPEGAISLQSVYRVMIEGGEKFSLGGATATLSNVDLLMPGNQRTIYGPNSPWGAQLAVGGNPSIDVPASPATATIAATDGNLHLDPSGGHEIYLGYYRGAGGIRIGNGGSQTVAYVTSSGEWVGTNVRNTLDNAYTVGGENARFATAYFGSNPIVSSDARIKLGWGPTLGLDFVLALEAGSYRLADAKVSVTDEPDGWEEVEEQIYETRKTGAVEIAIVDGKPVRKTVEREERVPVFDLLPLMDEDGSAVLDVDGKAVMHPVPRMHKVRRPKMRQVRKAGEGLRRHHGLRAQQVLEALEALGLTGLDFAGFIHDEGTDTWGLRYEQFIAPLISSVQSLSKKLDASEAERIQLIGQVAQLQSTVERLLLISGGAASQ